MRTNLPLVALFLGLFFFAVPASALPPSADWNAYQRDLRDGANLLNQKDFRGARDAFEEALRRDEGDVEAYIGMAVACFHLGRDEDAEKALRRAIAIDPREKRAYQMLGDLAYRRDDLEGAAANWQRVVELDPAEKELKARIDRIRRESRTEADFNSDATSHFSVKYEGRERIEAGRIVLRILEDAYSDIGRQLSFYPGQEIAVILYSDQQFREVTDAPGWSAGLYDGKIRIPIGGIDRETPALRGLLYHEYTHAVVRAVTPRVPAWLNEGLAQYFEGRTIDGRSREMLRGLAKAGKLPSLRSLDGSFAGLGGAEAQYAYLISLSVMDYLADRFGVFRVRMVLDELAGGADAGRAVENSLLVPFDEFERGWRESLE